MVLGPVARRQVDDGDVVGAEADDVGEAFPVRDRASRTRGRPGRGPRRSRPRAGARADRRRTPDPRRSTSRRGARGPRGPSAASSFLVGAILLQESGRLAGLEDVARDVPEDALVLALGDVEAHERGRRARRRMKARRSRAGRNWMPRTSPPTSGEPNESELPTRPMVLGSFGQTTPWSTGTTPTALGV